MNPVDKEVGLAGLLGSLSGDRKLLGLHSLAGTIPRSDDGLCCLMDRPGGSVKTPSSVSAVDPLQRLIASQSARVSLSEISDPNPEVVTESERA